MKIVLAILVVLSVVLSSVGMTACSCGGGGKNTPAPAQTQKMTTTAGSNGSGTNTIASAQTQATQKTTTTASSVADGSWGVPIYPGSKQVIKLRSDKDETLNDKPAVMEHRMFTTSAKMDDVAAFYKDKMSANGWEETSWMDMGSGDGGGFIAQFDKNNEQEIAVISCAGGSSEGGTTINVDWKYIK
jgi:hypothetical protein